VTPKGVSFHWFK